MIFADGSPGSGKSTTAAYVAGELEQRESHAGYSVSADRPPPQRPERPPSRADRDARDLPRLSRADRAIDRPHRAPERRGDVVAHRPAPVAAAARAEAIGVTGQDGK
jgi:hypothetical protein